MMTMYFENRYRERRPIYTGNSLSEAMLSIQNFLNGYNYKSYYMRSWTENNEQWFDVGSHSEFFVLVKD